MVKLSLDDLIKLYTLASIGKLVGGLIHNLNGPMQNLGLDIEMAHYSLKDESKWDHNTAKSIVSRLKRMEQEHDRINLLIKATSARTEDKPTADNTNLSSIHGFIKQELAYLDANLYFKHNVKKEIINLSDHASVSIMSKDSLAALSWFLQCLAEELERQMISGLTLRIISDNSGLKILFSIQGGELSEGFVGQLSRVLSSADISKPDNMDVGIFLILLIFQSNGIKFEFKPELSSSNFAINFS